MRKKRKILISTLTLLVGLSLASAAQSDTPSNDEIAKELANPNTALTSLKLQIQYFSFYGPTEALFDKTFVLNDVELVE